MNEPRYIRTLIVPLGVAVVFLVLTPSLCHRALERAIKRRPLTTATAATAPPVQGLVIASSTPPPAPRSAIRFPPGLDAARIQYLLEIDATFTVPMVMPLNAPSPVTALLLERQYIEKQPDETFVPTREGLMNLNGASHSPAGWVVPVARREFAALEAIEDAGEGRYDATVSWRWQPAPVFSSLLQRPDSHRLTAEFIGGEGHWVLARFVQEPDNDFR